MEKLDYTLEEFSEDVKNVVRPLTVGLGEERVERYLVSDEAKEEMKIRYDRAMKEYINGELTELQFREGIVHSCGYCLSLMCE